MVLGRGSFFKPIGKSKVYDCQSCKDQISNEAVKIIEQIPLKDYEIKKASEIHSFINNIKINGNFLSYHETNRMHKKLDNLK